MNVVVILVVFIILIGMGVATWYFLQPPATPKPKPKGGSGDDSGGGSGSDSGGSSGSDSGGSGGGGSGGSGGGSGSGPSVSVDDCTTKFEINNQTQCQNDTEAGVSWYWDTTAADGIGQSCKDKTVGYNVIASSSLLPGVNLAAYVDQGAATTTGIKNVPGTFIKDSQLTFSVMPIDADKNNLISAPTNIMLNSSSADSDCSKQGIESQIQDVNPFWNKNGYYWPVTVKNQTGSSTNLHVRVYDSKGTNLNDDKYPVPETKSYLIPQGGTLSISCYIGGGRGVSWTYDQLKSGNISSLTYKCSTGWFKTNINRIT